MHQFKENFTEESLELIAELEKCLLLLESAPDDVALVQQVFRAMHTLKGNASMFGFKDIASFVHHLESIYEYIRGGQQKITKDILNLTFSAVDHTSFLLQNAGHADLAQNAEHAKLTSSLTSLVNEIEASLGKKQKGMACDMNKLEQNNLTAFQIHFAPNEDIFYNGTNPLTLLAELKDLGECTVTARLNTSVSLHEIEPTYCYTAWDITLHTEADIGTIEQIFVFVAGKCQLSITPVSHTEPAEEQHNAPAPPETEVKNRPVAGLDKKKVISSIRVPSEKLDTLMSLVSELITLQGKLETVADYSPQSELIGVTENLEKILSRLRDNAFSMCLVPVKTMLTPFNRLVRDLAGELQKDVDFVTEGIDTELDKNIIEGLSDPLMHLLRNSIDHGIEDPLTRLKSGKSRYGKITFRAYCAGANVFIEIEDDGKGLDAAKIRRKAIEKKLIDKDEVLSDKEILNLIFLPGFSTADQISNISGRGVGMDVVKRKIEDIRGQIKITSQLNIGTTITIKLPITVSIIDGLLVKVSDGSFVIPLSSVERCYEAPAVRQLNRFNHVVVLDGQQIPFINLTEEFGGVTDPEEPQEIVLVYFEEKRVALIVDRVLGKFQAVLKPLGPYFQRMENISGATILGDGNIALVLDTNKVAEQYLNKKRLASC